MVDPKSLCIRSLQKLWVKVLTTIQFVYLMFTSVFGPTMFQNLIYV